MWRIRQVGWSAARGLLVLALSVVVLDVMASLVGPAVDRVTPDGPRLVDSANPWATAEPLLYVDNVRRELTVSYDDGRLRATYDLWLPASHPIYRYAETGVDPTRLVDDVFGEVSVGEYPDGPSNRATTALRFDPPRATRDPQGVGHVRLEATPYAVTLPDFDVRVAPSRLVVPTASDLLVVHGFGEQRVHLHAPEERIRYGDSLATVDRAMLGPVSMGWRGVRTEDFVTGLRRIGNAGASPVGGALWWLGSALPLLLLLVWLRRARWEYGPTFVRLFEVVAVATGLTLGAAVIALLLPVQHAIGPYADSWLASWSGLRRPPGAGGAELVTLVGALVVFPLAVARLGNRWAGRRPATGPVAARWSSKAALAALAAVAVSGLVLIAVHGGGWPAVGVAAGWMLGALLLWVLVSDLADMLGARRPWPVAAIVTATALGMLFAQRLLDPVPDGATNLARVIAFGTAVLAIVVVYAWFAARAVSTLVRGRWYGVLAAGIVLLSALPYGLSLLTARPLADIGVHSVIDVLGFLGALNGIVAFGCLLVGLRLAAGAGWDSLNRVAFPAALVFAAFALASDQRWAYLPVGVLLGLAVTAVLVRRTTQHLPDPVGRRLIERATLVELERGALQRRRLAMMSALDTVETAELGPLNRSRRAVEARLGALPAAEPSPPSARLAHRWRHGLYAALVGAAVGLPWTVLLLADVRFTTVDDGAALSWAVAQWAVFGFFFGYFYPWLRGHHGLAKGLSLTAIVVVPPLFYGFVWHDGDAWAQYGIDALKVLAFASVLGLVAGDRLLLGAVGLGWRHLRDLYRAS